MMSAYKNKHKNTQGNKALVKIQNAMFKGELRPNQPIVERQLSKQLRMSRTPVHEAIIKLQMMGLLTSLPGIGIAVAENTPKRIKDMYEVREVLELLVAKDVCEHATENQINKIEEYNRLSGEALSNNDMDEYVRYFLLYYDAILDGCSNDVLVTHVKWSRDLYFESRAVSFLTIDELIALLENVSIV